VKGLLAVLVVDDSPEELWRVSSPANNLLLPRKGQNTPKIGVDVVFFNKRTVKICISLIMPNLRFFIQH